MLRTDRLLLRPWRRADIPAWAALNADPAVRRWFPGLMTAREAEDQMIRWQRHIDRFGFGFWAVEAPGVSPLIGALGLGHVTFPAPFTPAVEIGWRLAQAYWSQGYATEGARAALAFGFERFAELVAFTVPGNTPSRRVMERIGMVEDPGGSFDHPNIAQGHPFRRHLLYRAGRPP